MPVYLYALADADVRARGRRGIQGERLRVLPVGSLRAIVGEMSALPANAMDALEAQDALVRTLAEATDALLPSRFGTHERSEAALVARLEVLAGPCAAALERVRGCEQMTLRVFSDAPPKAAQAKGGAGTRYLVRAKERLSPALPELDGARRALSRLIRHERVQGSDRPPLRASVFHLIPRGQAARYGELLASVAPPVGVRWLISGPHPAYAFGPEEVA